MPTKSYFCGIGVFFFFVFCLISLVILSEKYRTAMIENKYENDYDHFVNSQHPFAINQDIDEVDGGAGPINSIDDEPKGKNVPLDYAHDLDDENKKLRKEIEDASLLWKAMDNYERNGTLPDKGFKLNAFQRQLIANYLNDPTYDSETIDQNEPYRYHDTKRIVAEFVGEVDGGEIFTEFDDKGEVKNDNNADTTFSESAALVLDKTNDLDRQKRDVKVEQNMVGGGIFSAKNINSSLLDKLKRINAQDESIRKKKLRNKLHF